MAQQYDFLVQTPANASDLETRINVRPVHLQHNKPLIDAGKLLFGGPSLEKHPESPEDDLAITGSIMLIRAGSEDEVRDMIRNDPYAKAGFWYPERAVITPMRCVVRTKT